MEEWKKGKKYFVKHLLKLQNVTYLFQEKLCIFQGGKRAFGKNYPLFKK